MKILLDAFGGDNAPLEVLKGCILARESYPQLELALCGDESVIRACAEENHLDLGNIEILHAPGVIPVEAEPTSLLKDYADSSMAVGLSTLKEGKVDAFVSAGSTGALVVGATLIVKRLKGLRRVALGALVPNAKGFYLLMDTGANAECSPEMLCQFGLMGNVYLQKIKSVAAPQVGLVNIGAEETKGLPLQREAYALLQKAPLNFVGNVEARGLPLGECDVAVCDGFTGNIVLKTTEGMGKLISQRLKDIFLKNLGTKVAALLVKGGIDDFKRAMDYKEHGGAPLLGCSKAVIKAHGSSDAKAFKNAIRQAMEYVESDAIAKMQEALSKLKAQEKAEKEKE